jgi:peptide/nickel transport system permease protein
MGRYVLRRIAQMVPVALLVVVLNFVLITLAPGDPALVLAGVEAPQSYVDELRHNYGLDQPVPARLAAYLGRLVQGDLGYSFAYRRPVADLLVERTRTTLLLVLASQVLSIIAGTWLGAVAAWRHRRALDRVISYGSLLLYCMPVFWTGLLMIMLFSVELKWLPSAGMVSFAAWKIPRWLDVARHLVLPSATLFLYTLPVYVRITRASVLEVAREDYITTARAVGYPERVVYLRHALRNALLPTVTVAGMSLSSLLTGALLVETVFAWPGLGQLMFEAVRGRDFPVLMGGFIFATLLVLAGNLITDLIYARLDPRVTYG